MEIKSRTHQLIEDLRLQLTDYGLDPKDWQLNLVGKTSVHVINKTDDDFSFIGSYHPPTAAWRAIEILSL